jgi:hypothetical protein
MQTIDRALNSAMNEVIPRLPELMQPPSRWAFWRRDNPVADTTIRDAIAEAIEVSPDDPKHKHALDKGEVYTIVGAAALQMEPHLIAGKGHAAYLLSHHPDAQIPLFTNLSNWIMPAFTDAYSSVAAQPWFRRTEARAITAFGNLSEDRDRIRNIKWVAASSGIYDLRTAMSGGALGTTVEQLALLARKQQVKQGIELNGTTSKNEQAEILSHRRKIMHGIAYLATARAGLNLVHLSSMPGANPLDDLEGVIEEVTSSTGQDLTVFKRENAQNWNTVFPSPKSDLVTEPTLKCPFHFQTDKTQPTPLTSAVHAVVNSAHDLHIVDSAEMSFYMAHQG